jgi:hypothetical protein
LGFVAAAMVMFGSSWAVRSVVLGAFEGAAGNFLFDDARVGQSS